MDIRHAEAADREAVERLVNEAYAPYVPRMGKPPGPMLDDYAARIAERSVRVLTDGSEIVGLLVLLPSPGYLLLDNIAVAPRRQGGGVGRRLLAFAETEARQRGYEELRLYTNTAMHENMAMYPRLGWVEYDRAEQAGYSRVFFRKRLT